MASRLLFAVGASGVGKTTALQALRARGIPGLSCHHFDSLGVPDADAMVRAFGSPEGWQEAATREWVARLSADVNPLVILEGQTRPSFIRTALGGSAAGIVLLDCQPAVRSHRLRAGRQQPELDTATMNHWAVYLRGQADAIGLPVLDTTSLTPDDIADELYALVLRVPARSSA